MTYRWFIWGLSNGVFVLAFAGGFWFGLAASVITPSPLLALITVAQILILWGGLRLRRKAAGFQIAEARKGDDVQRKVLRQILVGFLWVAVAEGILVAAAVGLCVVLNRKDLMWPALGFAVSLHFAPLGYILRLRPYYTLAALGSLLSIVAVVSFTESARIIFLGGTLGAVVWLTAAYAIVRADRLAQRAVALFAARSSNVGAVLSA